MSLVISNHCQPILLLMFVYSFRNISVSLPNTIPEQDAVGVTIVLLTCSYRGQEFVRVGYFINNDYTDPELKEVPPPKPLFDKLTRNILATKPRVTRFKINWDDSSTSTNGEMNTDGASGSAEIFTKDDQVMEEEDADTMNGNDDGLAMEARLNENSNSLAMEC